MSAPASQRPYPWVVFLCGYGEGRFANLARAVIRTKIVLPRLKEWPGHLLRTEPEKKRKRVLLQSLVTNAVLLALMAVCGVARAAPASATPPHSEEGEGASQSDLLSAEASRKALGQGIRAYQKDDFRAAARAFMRAARAPRGVPSGRARYMLGLTQLALERYPQARETLLVAAREYVVLGDHALYYAGRAAIDAGDLAGGARILSQLRLNYLNSVWRADAARLVGLSFLALGNHQEARKALSRALGEGVPENAEADTRLAFGQAQEASGNLAAAVRVYRDVWVRYPETSAGDKAWDRFTRILRAKGTSPPYASSRKRVERADRLYERFHYTKALEAYQKLLDEARRAGDGSDIYRNSTRVAHCLFRLKRYPEATEAFRKIRAEFPKRKGIEETIFWEARSVTREARFDEALATHRRLIARFSRSTWARKSRYRLALLLEDRGRLAEARDAFKRLLKHGAGTYRSDVHWRLGWIAWKQDRRIKALEYFQKLARSGMSSADGRRGAYWSARVHEREKRRGKAIALYRSILRGAGLSYYRFAAEVRLEALGQKPPGILAPLPPRPPPRALAGLGAHYERGLELARLEQNEDASREFARVRYAKNKRLYFAGLFQDVEDYYRASRLVLNRRDMLRYTYPDAYAARVKRNAELRGIDPRMVWAVMREESAFRPAIRSPAGAVGLMQIIPPTAARLGAETGIGDAAEKLDIPRVNIRLGAYYLAWLMKRYEGMPARAVAGYNAGEEAVDRWLAELSPAVLKEQDAFIEEIPYRETRNYVKKVLKSYQVYRRLYPEAVTD